MSQEHETDRNANQEALFGRDVIIAYGYLQKVWVSYEQENGQLPPPKPSATMFVPIGEKQKKYIGTSYIDITSWEDSDVLQIGIRYKPTVIRVRRESSTGEYGYQESMNFKLYSYGKMGFHDYTFPAERNKVFTGLDEQLVRVRNEALEKAIQIETDGEYTIPTVESFNKNRPVEVSDIVHLHVVLKAISDSHPNWPQWEEYRKEQLKQIREAEAERERQQLLNEDNEEDSI